MKFQSATLTPVAVARACLFKDAVTQHFPLLGSFFLLCFLIPSKDN